MLGIWRPSSGAARLDGANVFEWSRAQLGAEVGYLPQDVELFYGTVRENIARMDEGDDEKVIAAAKMAGAHEMILKLPKGYDFPCRWLYAVGRSKTENRTGACVLW